MGFIIPLKSYFMGTIITKKFIYDYLLFNYMINEEVVFEQNKHIETGKAEFKKYHRHVYFDLIKYLKKRQIIILRGLRRVGKTTVLYQLMNYLLEKDVQKEAIFYYSFGDINVSIEEIIEFYKNKILLKPLNKQKIYFFFDEIQKIRDWQNKIKQYYDTFPNIKFILSGSANLLLDKRSKESLAGRIISKVLKPVSFREFLEIKGYKGALKYNYKMESLRRLYLLKNKLEPLFHEYLLRGMFFEIMDLNKKDVNEFLEKTIIERILFIDIPSEFIIEDRGLLKTLFEIIYNNPGLIIDYSSIGSRLNRDRKTISKYIDYLKFSLLIKEIFNYSTNKLTSAKKLKKAYPCIIEPKLNIGKIVESVVVNYCGSEFFWRDKQKREIDLVVVNDRTIPIEIKYRESITKKDLSNLRHFLKKYKLRKGIVVTKNTLKQDGKILHIPAWMFLLCY